MSSPSQKVVIPKGLVNPNETTIVEIPVNLQHVHTVIAKAKQDWSYGVNREYDDSSTSAPPAQPQPKVIKKRSYTRRSFPAARPKHNVSGGFGTTFGGVPYEEESTLEESSHGFHPYVPKPPRTPQVPEYGSFWRDVHAQSSLQDLSYEEGPMYRDFCRPKGASTPVGGTSGRAPASMRKFIAVSPRSEMGSSGGYTGSSGGAYPSSGGAYSSSGPAYTGSSGGGSSGGYQRFDSISPPKVCKTSITTTTPNEIQTTEYSEESWVDDFHPTPESTPPDSPSGSISPYTPFVDSRSPRVPPSASPPQASGKMTQGDIMNSLGQLESSELQKIMGDLSSFQVARRKLVFDASSLASAADVSTNLLHH